MDLDFSEGWAHAREVVASVYGISHAFFVHSAITDTLQNLERAAQEHPQRRYAEGMLAFVKQARECSQ